jgi:hypothetical protein
MENIKQILIANISMANFLQATKPYCDKHLNNATLNSTSSSFTDLGKESINNYIWKCYVPSSKIGKTNRELNISEASDLLQYVKHIDDMHLIAYYKKLPHDALENIFITIIFIDYKNDEITERINKALFIKNITKRGSRNGSIDVLKQEKEFQRSLKKGEKITNYIDRSGKHPLASFLNINPRTLKSFGGSKNEKK